MQASFSKSERRIVAHLNDDPHGFARANVKDVAAAVSVSEPTVVRFCRRVGCQGFKDFKLQIVQDLAYRQAISEGEPQEETSPEAGSGERRKAGRQAGLIHAAARTALDRTLNLVDWHMVERSAEAIVQARRVVIYGIGGSSATFAQEMHNRLFRLDISSMPFTDSYMQRMAAAALSRQDVALFISSTGRPRALYDSLELARHFGAKCIGIAPRDSVIGRDLDICLDIELTQGGVGPLHPNPMRYAQMMLVDCVAYAVALRMGERADAVLKRTRASVSSLHGLAPLQPIGD